MVTKVDRVARNCLQCGAPMRVLESKIRAGRGRFCSKSCGAAHRSKVHGHTTHEGLSATYRSWAAMKQRCGNPKAGSYARYGGRGIGYTPAWETFAQFLADMGERPEGKTLDRIDPEGDYGPSNCRWATLSEQQTNHRRTKRYLFGGAMLTLPEIASATGLTRDTLSYRYKNGWPQHLIASPPSARPVAFRQDKEGAQPPSCG